MHSILGYLLKEVAFVMTVYSEALSGCQLCPYGVGACFRDCPCLYH
jgi:hypothetical protein